MEPPFKRRRVARIDFTDEELQHRRARNDFRLKSAFESIFEKYGKDFTGIGDEIDLVTGEIVVNRGHLSSLEDEKNPGREEDLFDELDDTLWSGETRVATEKSHVRPRAIISASENSLSSGLDIEMRDPSQSSNSPTRLTGDATAGAFASETDEIACLHNSKSLSNLRAHSPHYPLRAVQNEDSVESKWRAPPLPDKSSMCEENPQTQNDLLSDACKNRSTSPPGKSLWAPSSKPNRKPQLARRRHTFVPFSNLSGLPFLPIKEARVRRSVTSLSYERPETSLNPASKRGSIDLPTKSPEASRSICKSVGNLPWTKYEDHKLYYLRSEAGMSDSQLARAFPNRSKTEIEERWLMLYMDDEDPLVHGTGHQGDRHTDSVNTPDVDRFGTHRQPSGDIISLPPIGIQPVRRSDTIVQQIFPIKPGSTEHIPFKDPQNHDAVSEIPSTGATVDLAIDLTFSDEEATKTVDSGYLTGSPEQTSKQDESSLKRTKGILKRVTRRVTIFNKVRGRALFEGRGAFASDETDSQLYTEIPEVQDQILLTSTPQLVPTSKKPTKRPRINKSATKARRQKQLALNRGSAKVRNQKPSTSNEVVTPSSEISTELSPSPCVATRSSRSPQVLEGDNINSNCRKEIPKINSGPADLRNCEDSEDVDCLCEALPVRIITPAKVRPQIVSSAPSSTTAHSKVMKTHSIPLRPRVIDDLSDDELATPVQNIRKSSLPKVISSPVNISRTKSVRV